MKQCTVFSCVMAMLLLMGAGFAIAQPGYKEILVNFEDDASQEEIRQIAEEYGVTLKYNSIFSQPEVLLRFPKGEREADVIAKLLNALTAEEEIEYAEPNYLYEAFFVPNDPMYKQQWHISLIHAEKAWDVSTGKGAVVAVIDTGVAFEDYKDKNVTYHQVPDLAKTRFVKGYDFIGDDEHANDDNAHGTHVAGTIAQSTNNKVGVTGVAFDAAIMPLKVLNKYGYGNVADIAEAIVYAADHGAHVINMSLGGGAPTKFMQEAIEYAYKKGVTIVCAAGNDGSTRPHYPAAYNHAIAVSSVGPDSELAPYSTHGDWISLAAPGGNTRTKREHGVLQNTIGRADPTKDGYEYFQGTSMAAPHVAGVAALIVSAGVKEPAKVEQILLETAVKKEETVKYGAGIVDAFAAVTAAKKAAGGSAEQAADAVAAEPAPPEEIKPPATAKEALLYFLAGVGFAIYYFKLLKRGDGYGKLFAFLFSLAMFLSSSGLFVVQYMPIPFVSESVLSAVSAPLPNLDRVFFGYSAGLINPLLHSAIIPFLLVAALLGTKYGRAIALGMTVGMAAHLFVDTFFSMANVTFIPGSLLLDKAWLLINGVLCFALAVLAERKP